MGWGYKSCFSIHPPRDNQLPPPPEAAPTQLLFFTVIAGSHLRYMSLDQFLNFWALVPYLPVGMLTDSPAPRS